MVLPEITEMQKIMCAARGQNVEIHLVGRLEPVTGKCVCYIQPIDNVPEVAAVIISVPGRSSLYEFTENEIKTINIKANE